MVARLAGDEFIFYMNHSITLRQSDDISAEIKHQFTLITTKYGNLPLDLSIDISHFPLDAQDSQALINIADYNMYLMKKKKRLPMYNLSKMDYEKGLAHEWKTYKLAPLSLINRL